MKNVHKETDFETFDTILKKIDTNEMRNWVYGQIGYRYRSWLHRKLNQDLRKLRE